MAMVRKRAEEKLIVRFEWYFQHHMASRSRRAWERIMLAKSAEFGPGN